MRLHEHLPLPGVTRSLKAALVPAFLICGALASAAEVAGVRLWAGEARTRVVLDLSGPVSHELMSLSDPARVVVDIADATLSAPSMPDVQGVVRDLRTGQPRPGILRVVLDLEKAVQPRSFTVSPDGDMGHRLVIDLIDDTEPVSEPRKSAQAAAARDVVVAISPGHGGHDPGATGRKGTREKDVVLAIARRVQAHLEKEPGIRGVLVRDGDHYVDHRQRMAIARDHRADLFVAIHADAFPDTRARGSTVYALSERGASSEAARWLADTHNAGEFVGGVTLEDKDPVLATVLFDLSQSATLDASMDVGQFVIDKMANVGRMRRKTVQQAGFLVLKSPDIPSILVETAFISNPAEEDRLRSSGHQDKWGRAIAQGAISYFRKNPPPGTLYARQHALERPEDVEYIIARGDTLSDIADRFNVPLRSLRQANRLRGDRIRVGQVLRIPASQGG